MCYSVDSNHVEDISPKQFELLYVSQPFSLTFRYYMSYVKPFHTIQFLNFEPVVYRVQYDLN
jgi:hypothetical protein